MPIADRFTDKVVFVTGAARGIGRAAAVAFAQEGAKLAIADLKEGDLQETADAVRALDGDVVTIGCDISAPEQVEAAVAKVVETYGRLDCAFNNAGIENKPFAVHEIPIDEWDKHTGLFEPLKFCGTD